MVYQNNSDFAREADSQDPVKDFRRRFYIPQHNGKDCIYFTGNSLGLQPGNTLHEIQQVLNSWSALAVEGHFKGENPWMHFHDIAG